MAENKKIGEMLLGRGLITDMQLKSALEEQRRTKEFLGALLLRKRQIKPADLMAVLSEIFKIPCMSMKNVYVNWNLIKTFSASLVLDYKCIPVKKDENSITVAIVNPSDVWALKRAEEETGGFKLKLVLIPQDEADEVVRLYKQRIKGNIIGGLGENK
ncbi:MAG: hypothetical protein V1682_06130 [Candidatus Omnitrophota bacterium]